MRLYRHITLFRILRNPCNKEGFHSTARHFIPDNTNIVSNPPGSEIKMLSQHKAYEMVKNMNDGELIIKLLLKWILKLDKKFLILHREY